MNREPQSAYAAGQEFWRGRCIDCAHPEHEMTCHEMVSNGDPSNGPAYCPCAVQIEHMEQDLVRLRLAAWRLSNAAASLSEHAKRADDPAHRSWFPAATGDVDREVGLARRAAGPDPFAARLAVLEGREPA